MPTTHPFHSDVPTVEDRFSRRKFAGVLARALCLPPSAPGLVVAIDGPWGSGKSSFIGFIRAALEAWPDDTSPAPVILDFNPWMIAGADSLVTALIEQMAVAVGQDTPAGQIEKGLNLSRKLLDYVGLLKYLKYVPGGVAVGNLAEAIGDLTTTLGHVAEESQKAGEELTQAITRTLPKRDLNGAKGAVMKAIAELARPIVVVIDDLDRLRTEEIRAIFQAVKAVANFPQVTYLLAFDAEAVAKALSDACPDGDGRAYLEKIVQVAYPLPALFPWQLRGFLQDRLAETSTRLGIRLRSFESSLWPDAVKLAARTLRHPRDAIRLVNRLTIAFPGTDGNVNLADVLVMEAIAQRWPALHQAVRLRPQDFTGFRYDDAVERGASRWNSYVIPSLSQDKNRWEKHLPAGDGERSLAEQACRFLFPFLTDLHPTGDPIKTLRVSETSRLARYFSLTGLEDIPEASRINALIQRPDTLSAELDTAPQPLAETLAWVAEFIGSDPVPDPQALVQVVVEATAAHCLAYPPDDALIEAVVGCFTGALRTMATGREALCAQWLLRLPLAISHDIVVELADEWGLWHARPGAATLPPVTERLLHEEPAARALVDQWCARVEAAVESGELSRETRLHAILFRWAQLGPGYQRVHPALARFCASDQGLAALVAPYADRAIRHVAELDLIWDGPALIQRLTALPQLKSRCGALIAALESEELHRHRQQIREGSGAPD